jgi:hypothetical protein
MKVQLTESYVLSDEHCASGHGQAVLVDLGTNEAYRPGDMIEPYASWGLKPAAFYVARIYRWKRTQLTDDEQAFVEKFIEGFTG